MKQAEAGKVTRGGRRNTFPSSVDNNSVSIADPIITTIIIYELMKLTHPCHQS